MIPGAPRLRRVLALALPIIGGMVSQNVLNLVDTAMVGSFGDAALAAVSSASFVNFMCIAAITGLSAGVQTLASRRYGAGEASLAPPLNAGLLLAVVVGVPATGVLWLAAPSIYGLVNDDPAVVEHAVPYLRARLLGMVAVGANFAFRGFWNGVDRSRLYLSTLLVMHAINVAVSYGLIFGAAGLPELGPAGAGLGTSIATWCGTALYALVGLRHAPGFLAALPGREDLRTLLRQTVPSAVQQFMFAAGLTALFAIIGQVGTAEVAAAGVLLNVSLIAFLPTLALGMAAATLVGQSLGARAPDDAERWAWDVVRVGLLVSLVLGLPMVAAPELLLAPFLRDPATRALAEPALRLVGATLFIDAVGTVLMQALVGAGAPKRVLLVSVVGQWGVFLPLAWLVGPVLGGSLTAIWSAQVVQRAGSAAVFAAMWRRGDWKRIAL